MRKSGRWADILSVAGISLAALGACSSRGMTLTNSARPSLLSPVSASFIISLVIGQKGGNWPLHGYKLSSSFALRLAPGDWREGEATWRLGDACDQCTSDGKRIKMRKE